jgi:hypothetical protein
MGKQPAPVESTAQHAFHSPEARGTTLGKDLLTASQNVVNAPDGAGYQERGVVLMEVNYTTSRP